MKVSKPYFSHDISAKQDEKIIRMMYDFRKHQNGIIAHAVYGIYWEIIEYLHENSLGVDELEMLSDVLRVDKEVLVKILNDYGLFKVVDNKYISERVLRNLKQQEEKSKKAREKVGKRWNKRGEEAVPTEEETEGEITDEYDEEQVKRIIEVFNDKFDKEQIVSEENKQRIYDIHKKNKLTEEVWEKIFSNAKRGWDIGEKKNVAPNLKKILDEWDSFASDDYFLAPDREAVEKEKEAQKIKREQENQEKAKEKEEFERSKKAICDKNTAIEHINKYFAHSEEFLKKSPLIKKYMNEYGFRIEDILKARDETINTKTNLDKGA